MCGLPLADNDVEFCFHCAALRHAIDLLRKAEQTPEVVAFLKRIGKFGWSHSTTARGDRPP